MSGSTSERRSSARLAERGSVSGVADTFVSYADYELPLLQVLAGLPGGQGAISDVLDLVWQQFSSYIPAEHRASLANRRELKWQNMVRWARNTLVKRGLMGAPRFGVWSITSTGRDWLAGSSGTAGPTQAPQPGRRNAPGPDPNSDERALPMDEKRPSTLDRVVAFSLAGQRFALSGRQVLERARRAIANGVPPEASNYISWVVEIDGQMVGLKWLSALVTGLPTTAFQTNQTRPFLQRMGLSVRRLEAPAVAPTAGGPAKQGPATPTGVYKSGSRSQIAILDSQIADIRGFLNGRAGRPSDERLCDWVNFCYEFGLYREGRDLFRLIDPSQVNDWYYERTRRLARVCAMKTSGQA